MKIGLFVIDIQEKLFPKMEASATLVQKVSTLIEGFSILSLPVFFSEQYPQGLGATIAPLQRFITTPPFVKTHFSCLGEPHIRKTVLEMPIDTWVLAGIETHICLFQTARDFVAANKKVIVCVDATASRCIHDRDTALHELREMGVRTTTCETLLFELLGDAKHPQFKSISQLVK